MTKIEKFSLAYSLKNLSARLKRLYRIHCALYCIVLLIPLPLIAEVQFVTDITTAPIDFNNPGKFVIALQEQLGSHAIIRSRFKQQKFITALKQPIESSGNFVFSRNQGLLWNIEAPMESLFIVTEDSLLEQITGNKLKRLSTQQQSIMQHFRLIFTSLFSGDVSVLSKNFLVHCKGDLNDWALGLSSGKGVVGKIFRRIELRGGEFVEHVVLLEVSGDSTMIDFVDISSDSKLTSAEESYFEG